MIRVLLADDHGVLRDGLRRLLEADPRRQGGCGRLMEKLQLDDLPALVKFAIRHGITGTG